MLDVIGGCPLPVDSTKMKFKPVERKRKGVFKNCLNCGREFYLTPSRAKRNERFCSKKCELAYKKIDKVCPVCGKTFTVNKSVADRYTVCSWKCRTAETKYVTCERCGKVFRAEKRLNRHYCSEECRRPPNYINCRNCGKKFRVMPKDTDRQFCSFACYRKFQGENQLEKKIRETLNFINVEYIQEAKMGRYSVDFLIPKLRIALEIDGAYWHRNVARDKRKNVFLRKNGWSIIRLSENEIINSRNIGMLVSTRLKEVADSDLIRRYPTLFEFPNGVVKC